MRTTDGLPFPGVKIPTASSGLEGRWSDLLRIARTHDDWNKLRKKLVRSTRLVNLQGLTE